MERIWQRYQSGALTPAQMLAEQDAECQPCINHPSRPGKAVIDDVLYCTECYVSMRLAGRA
jgi:hypothetical protein